LASAGTTIRKGINKLRGSSRLVVEATDIESSVALVESYAASIVGPVTPTWTVLPLPWTVIGVRVSRGARFSTGDGEANAVEAKAKAAKVALEVFISRMMVWKWRSFDVLIEPEHIIQVQNVQIVGPKRMRKPTEKQGRIRKMYK
jgi:hypothetical protein